MSIILKQQHRSHNTVINSHSSINKVLESLRDQSLVFLEEDQRKDIQSLILMKQSTTYQIMLLNQNQYIAHQFTKVNNSEDKKEAVQTIDLLGRKFLLDYQLTTQKSNKIIVVKNLSTKKGVDDFHKQLKSKLSEINTNIDKLQINNHRYNHKTNSLNKNQSLHESTSFNNSTSLNSIIDKKRMQSQVQKIMQFKQPSYWIKNEQKSQKAKQFLQHHRKQQLLRQKRQNQSMEKYQQQIQQEDRRNVQSKKQSVKQILKKGLQRTLQYKDRRQHIMQTHQSQLQRIEQFFQKINPTSKHLYKQLQQQYTNKQKQQYLAYKQKLLKIKQDHSPVQKQQLQQHRARYQEYKESLNEELRNKKEQLRQQLLQINEELKGLFKSRQYDAIAENQGVSSYKRSMSEIIQRRAKKKQFALKVKENFVPQVSEKKRQQMEESIRLLQIAKDKSKRKVHKNGQLQFQDKQDIDGRKKGIQYLAYLKKYLQNKPHKPQRPISTSLILQSSHPKKIDYLRENKPTTKLKASLQQWKKVIDDSTFNPKDKYTFLKESVSTLQHKAFEKEIEARNLKKSPQQLEKKEQFDKLYLESIQAKMAILNNLMLGRK